MTVLHPAAVLSPLTRAEVATQPEVWERVLALPDAALAALPGPGLRVLGLGCGSSASLLDSYARLRQARRIGPTRAAVPSELDDLDVTGPVAPDAVVALSRSGTTGDVLRAVERLGGRAPVVAITATAGSPIIELAAASVVLDFADEDSVVQTRSATAALLALRRSLADPGLAALPAAGRAALADPLVAPPEDVDAVVFLGTGWTLGLAHEGALKCREAARLDADAYPVLEYRHGPIARAGERTLVWSLAPLPDPVADAVRATGAVLRVARDDPQAELVRVHRLALAIADLRGVDADAPAHLSRSVLE